VDAPAEQRTLKRLLALLEAPGRAAELAPRDGDGDGGAALAIARHHRLTPLLGATCGEALGGAFGEACRRDRTVTAARNILLAQAAEECLQALARRGIEAALLKGLAYEPFLYGRSGCRPTGDIDLLVRDGARRAACETLAEIGFEPKAAAPGFDEPDYHEIAWTRGPVSVDLHLGLAPPHRCAIDYRAVWSGVREVPYGGARAFLLAGPHAAAFHALHMAIDHYDVPAVYLVDLARLQPTPAETGAAEATARSWRCHRAFATAAALAAAFLPKWASEQAALPVPDRARGVIAGFGGTRPLPRPEQLRRKVAHIDGPALAASYLAVQARRNLRELLERHVRHRTPRERLGL
jgi:hypothetical protein